MPKNEAQWREEDLHFRAELPINEKSWNRQTMEETDNDGKDGWCHIYCKIVLACTRPCVFAAH